jgi:zinc/manganese transport system substrate-binding protein
MIKQITGSLFFTALASVSQIALAQVQVVTSFSILGDLATQVGGDAVEVSIIVGPDQDAHIYRPSVADARAVAEADLIVLNGLGFESWSQDLVAGSGTDARILTVTDTLPFVIHTEEEDGHKDEEAHEDEHHEGHDKHEGHDDQADAHHDEHQEDHDDDHKDAHHEAHEDTHEGAPADGHGDGHEQHSDDAAEFSAHAHDHGDTDPHAWGAVANGIAYAAAIRDAFSDLDPANADVFTANFAAFEAQALAAQQSFEARIAALPADHRTVVTSHDAFGYMAEETGLTFLAPLGLNTASAATASQVRDLIDQLKALPHAALFVENIVNPALVQQIADETGLAVGGQLYSDALSGPEGPAATYLEWYSYNMDSILTALEAG